MKKNCDLLIHQAQLVTCADNGREYGMLSEAAVACSAGKIIWLGDSAQAKNFTATSTIDAAGKVVTPGLIDCHTHLVFAGSRANEFAMRLAGASYEDIARAGGGICEAASRSHPGPRDCHPCRGCGRDDRAHRGA